MLDITRLFEGVTTPPTGIKPVTRVGIDVAGTLINFGPLRLDQELAAFGIFLHENHAPTHVISSDATWSIGAMGRVNADQRLWNVMSKKVFYDAVASARESVLVIDDDEVSARRAAMHIHPKDPKFREFLRTRAYEQLPLPIVR